MKPRPRKAVFLDRDGTIIHGDPPKWICSPADVKLLPGAAAAIRRLNRAGYAVVILTNQSGIARGYFTVDDLAAIHTVMLDRLNKAGAWIDGIYSCPHHPEAPLRQWRKNCTCRKPKKGMLRAALRDLNLTTRGSFVAGDATRDVELAKGEELTPILVLTGKGKSEEPEARRELGKRLVVFRDLAAAAKWIIAKK